MQLLMVLDADEFPRNGMCLYKIKYDERPLVETVAELLRCPVEEVHLYEGYEDKGFMDDIYFERIDSEILGEIN